MAATLEASTAPVTVKLPTEVPTVKSCAPCGSAEAPTTKSLSVKAPSFTAPTLPEMIACEPCREPPTIRLFSTTAVALVPGPN